MNAYYAGCLSLVSFQKSSNLSNVVLEALGAGAPLLSLDDGSLDGLVEHRKSGLLVKTMAEAAIEIQRLIRRSNVRKGFGCARQTQCKGACEILEGSRVAGDRNNRRLCQFPRRFNTVSPRCAPCVTPVATSARS